MDTFRDLIMRVSPMDSSRNIKYYDELDNEGQFDLPYNGRKFFPRHNPKQVPVAIQQFVQNQDDSRHTFNFTYKAARFEESWLLDSLGYFYEQKWISDVLFKIKAGKEASVYLCKAGEQVNTPLIAAKVYRPRMLRNLRDDHIYREGRTDLDEDGHELHDEGSIHAILTRSHYGEEVRHQSWIAHEFTAMQTLFRASADIPRPYEMAHNAILMDYVGNLTLAAPILNTVTLGKKEASQLFSRLMHNLDIMLEHEYVHGDLSAYNVLYWEGDISLIDFPQVVSPQHNRTAFSIFERDMIRLCEYFIRQGLQLKPLHLAADLWTAHGYHLRPEVHPRLLDAEDPGDL
jgi:RIO kinase 1